MSSFSNRHYSRSTVSLSRPRRLSSLTPIAHLECSSRSETLKSSEGISEKGESPNSKSSTCSTTKRASTAEIAYAIAYDTRIPGTEWPRKKHWRTVSAPNATAGVQALLSGERMAMGWKPNLEKSKTVMQKPLPTHFERLVRSASAELLGRFGPLAKDEEKKWKKEFELEMDTRLNAMSHLPFSERKSMSTDAETLRESYDAGSLDEEVRFEDAKEVLVVRPVSRDIAFL
ncbi:hypothetical protein N0V94_007040 [Neodidymelliopsis sp. IMI 364377]|nr:hypothetical protein N0V94_007040 [Neodidymelliopsis sp. IMI 364377]